MPALAALAARATRFADASASAAWTAPSVTTLLTGFVPARHGTHANVGTSKAIPEAIATLAEYLRSAGYATAACTGGGFVSEQTRLEQGFDTFEPNWTLSDATGALGRWIAARDRSRPSFLFLHTYDAHDPYGEKPPRPTPEEAKRVRAFVDELRAHRDRTGEFPPERLREMLIGYRSDPLTALGLVTAFTRQTVHAAIVGYDMDVFATSAERAETVRLLRERYLAGLRLVDENLQRVLARLDEAALGPETILVVTTDHGESFGEHDNLGHGRWLYDELARAVLLVFAPSRMPLATAVRGSCGLVDVVPTVLDLVGLPPPGDLDGRSLLPLANGRAPGHAVLADEHRMVRRSDRARVPVRLVSARTERAKWIGTWNSDDGSFSEVVYDLEADPREKVPLPAEDLSRFGPALEEGVRRGRETAKGFPLEEGVAGGGD
jgi:arylsulfatase A-like enzyme